MRPSPSSSIVYLLLVLLMCCAVRPVSATNTDMAKERRWAEQVVESLLDGDELWLIDDIGHEFLGILTEADKESGQPVILVHGIGVHPNWPDVIYPLRTGLLEQEITTVSLQMPILANDADPREYELLFPEVPGRIVASLEYLEENGYRNVAIVSHSMGSTMSAYYLSRISEHNIGSFVAIGMGPGISSRIDNVEALKKININILDLFGSQDLEPVLATAGARAEAAASRSEASYSQIKVEGAGHFFQGYEKTLVSHVIEWLAVQQQ